MRCPVPTGHRSGYSTGARTGNICAIHRLDRVSGKEMDRLLLPEPVQPAILPSAAGLFFAGTGGDVLLVG
jgi:hypothetical protein